MSEGEDGSIKQFSHAWLAFKAIERLEKIPPHDRLYADALIRFFWNHRDGVIWGAWYPDMIIKNMATSNVLKFAPGSGSTTIRTLPSSCLGAI